PCHDGRAIVWLHELPPDDHADSSQPRALPDDVSEVPPTAITYADVDGYAGPTPPLSQPLSPVAAKIAMPGWLKYVSSCGVVLLSVPAQLLLITVAPSVAA